MKTYTAEELKVVLSKHALYLRGEAGGERAYLQRANLQGADLQRAYLRGANLQRANLRDANLLDANLQGANLPAFQLPREGPLVVWKKAFPARPFRVHVLLKLEVRGKRTATPIGRKCRAEAAKVLGVYSLEGGKLRTKTARSMHDVGFFYTVGKVVRVKDYDDDIRVECTRGIHFFQTFEEARDYSG
jgi:hypothetical protein